MDECLISYLRCGSSLSDLSADVGLARILAGVLPTLLRLNKLLFLRYSSFLIFYN